MTPEISYVPEGMGEGGAITVKQANLELLAPLFVLSWIPSRFVHGMNVQNYNYLPLAQCNRISLRF